MQLITDLMQFTLGAGITLAFASYLIIRQECRHAINLNEEWEDGRKSGYHQCWREMVKPLCPELTPGTHNTPYGIEEKGELLFGSTTRQAAITGGCSHE